MKNNKKNIIPLCAFSILLASNSSFAQLHNQAEVKPRIDVSPKSCITAKKGENCELTLQIELTLENTTDVCLYFSHLPAKSYCYHGKKQYQYRIQIKASSSVNIYLVEQKSKRQIAQTSLHIGHYEPTKYRRKRRFGWSL